MAITWSIIPWRTVIVGVIFKESWAAGFKYMSENKEDIDYLYTFPSLIYSRQAQIFFLLQPKQ